MAQQFYIIKFPIKQMRKESLWEEFLDGIDRALCLLQVIDERNRFILLGGQNPLATAQLRNRRTDGNSGLDDQRLKQLVTPRSVISDGNQVLLPVVSRVVEDREIMRVTSSLSKKR